MSKIYEALKRAAEDRAQTQARVRVQPPAPAGEPGNGDLTAEEYQKLRASLMSVAVPSGLHTILLTAARHGEGTTSVGIGLASALAKERDARVLLVEGNLRTPCFRVLFDLPSGAGVSDFRAGRAAPEALASRVDGQSFSVIAAGAAGTQTSELEIFDPLLARLRPQFDFILIDGPPVNAYADATVLAAKVDGVILVVEADRTPVVDAETATRQLDKVGARVLGVVLNRRRSYIPAFLEGLL